MDRKQFDEKYGGLKVEYQWFVDNPALQLAMGNMYFKAGKWEEAASIYSGLLEELRFDANAHWNLMLCLTKNRLGNFQDFVKLYLYYEGSNSIDDIIKLEDGKLSKLEQMKLLTRMLNKMPAEKLKKMNEIYNNR
ncbi:tetratricopeptide repeat protein [Candidatus Parvarchaeota archaeon]|nr:tetratricopeptide repeat protein [Candidatus Parvarchaeota archaeon]